MNNDKATVTPVAELVGGRFDGHRLPRSGDSWPEFVDMGLEFHSDYRRVLYRFEPLANGRTQYVFDCRYNLPKGMLPVKWITDGEVPR